MKVATLLVVLAVAGWQRGGAVRGTGKRGGCGEGCRRRPQIGKTVAEMKVPEVPPIPQGGTLQAGTYVVMEMTAYTGPGGDTGPTGLERAWTMRISPSGSPAEYETTYIHLADPCPEYHRSEEHTSELQSLRHLVCRLLL